MREQTLVPCEKNETKVQRMRERNVLYKLSLRFCILRAFVKVSKLGATHR